MRNSCITNYLLQYLSSSTSTSLHCYQQADAHGLDVIMELLMDSGVRSEDSSVQPCPPQELRGLPLDENSILDRPSEPTNFPLIHLAWEAKRLEQLDDQDPVHGGCAQPLEADCTKKKKLTFTNAR